MALSGWSVAVLGVPTARGPSGEGFTLERRAAALLVYVGLQGSVSKLELARLLWPERPLATVRNNMRQLLRRLRLATGGALLVAGEEDLLELAAGVALDVRAVRDAVHAGRYAQVVAAARDRSELLLGLEFDDCPEFERWLDGARVTVAAWCTQGREGEVQRLEALGERAAAVSLALEWARAEPTSEEAARQLIRLHVLRGERAAALAVYERLREVLARELDVTPSAETVRLVRELTAHAARPTPAPRPPRTPLPLSVLRPPVLAEREAAWAELEDAWDAGVQLCFVEGAAGVGKSRLADEFAEAQGPWLRLGGQAGERDVPYAAQSRALRTLLAARPDVRLAPWVRRELSRILPELAEEDGAPPPFAEEYDLLRFYDANLEAMRALHAHVRTVVVDDVQYWDGASARLFAYVLSRRLQAAPDDGPRFLDCYRPGEASPELVRIVRTLTDAGLARTVALEPLSEQGVRRLVAATGLAGAEAHAARLTQYTGGNPLYVVETLKHLLETGALEAGWPERLPPPGRVLALIQRRLEPLRPDALLLARFAALAGPQFRMALAAQALDLSALQLSSAAAELEAALLLVEGRFTHDLVQEAVVASTPLAVRVALHVRLAEALEARQASDVLVAQHWLEAGERERAVPRLLAAAARDEGALLPGEAAALYARAADLLEGLGRTPESHALRERAARCRAGAARRN